MKDQTNRERYEIAALGEMMLLDTDRLPPALAEELTVLQDMLEVAVADEGAENAPVPPAYGKRAVPCEEPADGKAELPLRLRRDQALPFGERLIALSPRQNGEYVTVPRVVREGGSDA